MWSLNAIWDHLSCGMFPWSRLIGNWLHINKQEKFSWKSRNDILLKTDTHHLMTPGFVVRVGVPITWLYLCLSAILSIDLLLTHPKIRPSFWFIRGQVHFCSLQGFRGRGESNSGFCKGFIINCHLLNPLIKLRAHSGPAGWRPVSLHHGFYTLRGKLPFPKAFCQFHSWGLSQNRMHSTPKIPPHAVIKLEILEIFLLLIYISPSDS